MNPGRNIYIMAGPQTSSNTTGKGLKSNSRKG